MSRMVMATAAVIAEVERRRAAEVFDYAAYTDILPCGDRAIYIPYSARATGQSVKVGRARWMDVSAFKEAIPDLIVVNRSGPAHGWRCWAEKNGQRWEGTFGPERRISEDAPTWAREAFARYFFNN